MRSKFEIVLLAFVIISFLSNFGAALEENEIVYENYTVNVGQVFVATVHGDDIDVTLLPSWIKSNGTALFGIPQLQEFYTVDGKEKVETVHLGKNVYATITFLLKEKNICGFEESVFMEVNQKKEFTKYTSKEISDIIQDFAVMMDLKPNDIRALPSKYLSLYREENNVVYGDDDVTDNDVLVIVWVLSCGDFGEDEDLVNTINVVKNNNYKFRITQGFLMDINWASDQYLKKIDTTKLLETTTLSSLRTTRRADHPPKRINSLPSYECIQGKVCKLSIPAHTFIDEQPIDTLQYTVYPMTHGKNFLDANYPIMEGVPLENGEFDFRLEARDNMKQATSAPFRVVVKPENKSDYSFEALVDKEIKQINGTIACKFIDRLANVLKLDAEKIRINAIQPAKGNWQTIISWSYLSYQTTNHCNTESIYLLKRKMSNKRGNPHQTFVKNMGQEVHVREVTLSLAGLCNTTSASIDSTSSTLLPKDSGKTPSNTEVEPTSGSESMIPPYLLGIIPIVFIIILLTILIVYCCMFKKSGKKGKNQLDYVTKGQPVVFPNELATDDDTPSVATPMLVKDERPPLQPNLEGTTIHENPLYKAPSVARTSISTTNGHLNTATTFRQPNNNNNNANQRLPPPYSSP